MAKYRVIVRLTKNISAHTIDVAVNLMWVTRNYILGRL